MSMKNVLKGALLAVTLGIVASQSVLAENYKHVYAENRTYTRGEVLWVSELKSVNQSFTVTWNDLKNVGDPDTLRGEMGIAVTDSRPEAGPVNVGRPLPDVYLNWGNPNNQLAWTVIGELTARNPRETVTWKLDRWSLPTGPGAQHTIEFSPMELSPTYGLAKGKMRKYKDLFTIEGTKTPEPIQITLTGRIQVAVFCNTDTCTLPPSSENFVVNLLSVGLSAAILPNSGGADQQTQLVVDDYYWLIFDGVEACTYKMDETEHIYENALKVGKKGSLLSLEQPKSSTLTVKCGAGNKDRRAYVLLGSPNLVDNRKLVATNLRGIGIAYNDKPVTDCSNNLEYETKIPVGWTRIKLDGTEYIGKKTFHFGICQYEAAKNTERGEFHGSVQYVHWLE